MNTHTWMGTKGNMQSFLKGEQTQFKKTEIIKRKKQLKSKNKYTYINGDKGWYAIIFERETKINLKKLKW